MLSRPRRCRLIASVLVILVGAQLSSAQQLTIGIIDFYGLGPVSEGDARQALTVKEGDKVSVDSDERPAFIGDSERRLSTVPGVVRARLNLVCCDAGRAIVYVGIEGKGRSTTTFRSAPAGAVRLAADIVQDGKSFDEAMVVAVQRGAGGEDDSQGHALSEDPATRAIQERFVGYAARDLPQLRRVLRESSDAEHRALAAQVLGYAANKDRVVGDLLRAMRDASEEVRNNAMRALAVFANAAPAAQLERSIPYDGFVALLKSPVWSDRNKASWALAELSERRDPRLLEHLRREAIVPLVEMARWKSRGHAAAALTMLGRIAGLSDEVAAAASAPAEREAVIKAALDRK
jgi:HEAT repeats